MAAERVLRWQSFLDDSEKNRPFLSGDWPGDPRKNYRLDLVAIFCFEQLTPISIRGHGRLEFQRLGAPTVITKG
jgi:hypothetical protein